MAMPEPLYETPALGADDRGVLSLLSELRQELSERVAAPARWPGALRRTTFARAVRGSNSIEGYHATLEDVAAVIDDEPVLSASEETQAALAGYRNALTFALRAAADGSPLDEGVVKAMHHMMLGHEPRKSPGQWRRGEIFVDRQDTGERVYTGPGAERLADLTSAFFSAVREEAGDPLVGAAMAHLNFVMIHPFRDGNGRVARGLQTFLLARSGMPEPVFSSIEEYLGRNTPAYYDVLGDVGQGAWNPSRDARPWLEFCLTAHYHQVVTNLRRIEETEDLWRRCAELVHDRRLPSRSVGPLMDSALGVVLRNRGYREAVERAEGDEITQLVASRDLQALSEAGVLNPVGERRGRYYLPARPLLDLAAAVRTGRPERQRPGPYEVVREGRQLRL